MHKKYKRAIIISLIVLGVVAIILILASLSKIELNQYGLNYNRVTSNYTDNNVYGPGLYFIGVTNTFLKINKNYKSISLKNITGFTTDFYRFTTDITVMYILNINLTDTVNAFNNLSNYYILFGDHPEDILQSIIKNEVINVASGHNSSYYQTTGIMNSLSGEMMSTMQSVIQQWSSVTIKVIIQNFICETNSNNTEIITREIQYWQNEMQRVVNEKIDLGVYFANALNSKVQDQALVFEMTKQKIQLFEKVISLYNTTQLNMTIAKILYNNLPYKYNANLAAILQELANLANQTSAY